MIIETYKEDKVFRLLLIGEIINAQQDHLNHVYQLLKIKVVVRLAGHLPRPLLLKLYTESDIIERSLFLNKN